MSLRQKNPIVASMFHQLPPLTRRCCRLVSGQLSMRFGNATPPPQIAQVVSQHTQSQPDLVGAETMTTQSRHLHRYCSRQVFEIFPMLRWLSTKRMTTPVTAVNLTTGDTSATGTSQLDKRLFLILAAIALIYAFLAGLRTVSEFDLGWQMAMGRWVVQHHHVPSTDVFSYTAQGEPWIYAVGGGLAFYLAYLLGGYGLISWIGAAACVGTVALLLRRGSAVGAGIAILAVPLIAWRTAPRAEMFTVVLFAAFLSLLWENYQTGRARLWLLPLLMLAWVNLHL